MSTKAPPLSSSLVVRKGQATPTVSAQPLPTPPPLSTPLPTPPPTEEWTALTLKLDDGRYRRLKELGLRRPRRTSQKILVAALDAYLAAEGV